MAFTKQTIRDVDLAGKTVLVRVDYNVPVDHDGSIGDLFRLRASLPTLEYLFEANTRIILISHLGRPVGKVDPKFSLEPIADKLGELLNRQVRFVPETVGTKVQAAVKAMESGGVLLLENLRFHPGEEANDPVFAKQLADLADIFVQDGFGVVHRAHASTQAITEFLPAVAGLLLEKEVSTITEATENPQRPLVAIVGGAKVSDKLELLGRLGKIADKILIGGAMANTFWKAQSKPIGKSVYEAGQDGAVQTIRAGGGSAGMVLPDRVAVGKSIEPDSPRRDIALEAVASDDFILDNDFSPWFTDIKTAHTVIWNGPIGMTELANFQKGSLTLAQAISQSSAQSVVGGGDTVAFIEQVRMIDKFTWVSTGGGASLELMAGKPLPGVEALLDKTDEIS